MKKPNGKLQIYIDPISLNKAIKREHLHPPLPKKSPKCQGHLIFQYKYWQIKVDEKGLNLLTFGTRSAGRYRFKRLSYGIHSASEVFQREVTQLFSTYQAV